MSNTKPCRVEHSLDEETFTLTSESFPDVGPGRRFTTRWANEEEMGRNLPTAMESAEAHLISLEGQSEEIYAGPRAETAKSKMKRVRLPFGYECFVGVFTGHEYDEASIVIGRFKAIVGLKLTGGFYWKTLRMTWAEEGMLFGLGNATSALFVGKVRRRKK